VKRREFITLFCGTTATWPLAARAQQPTMPVIGFLSSESPGEFTHLLAAFRQGLGQIGYVEHRNVGIEYGWAEGQPERVPALVRGMVDHRVVVITATGGTSSVVPAKAATTTIPIVFVSGSDPVRDGLVASLSRPGGNATGVMLLTDPLHLKRLELARELVHKGSAIAVLTNPSNPNAERNTREFEDAARTLGQKVDIVRAGTEGEFEASFATIVARHDSAVVVSPDVFFNSHRRRLVALAAHYAVPAIYQWREYVDAGGLLSYGASRAEAYRLAGTYVGRILKGEKAADLPVQQPTKFDLVINLKTARALGLDIPATLLARADEVIE
jgi:putative ABC transport system substrate-binding protein